MRSKEPVVTKRSASKRKNFGDGLYHKGRRWIFRYSRPNGAGPNEMGFGLLSRVSLKQARAKVHEARKLLDAGKDPVQEKRQKRLAGTTFRQVATEWLELKRTNDGWSDSHVSNAEVLVFTHGEPLLNEPVGQIDETMVRKALAPVIAKHPDQGHRARRMWKKIFDYAKFQKLRTGDNPADWIGNLEYSLPKLKDSGEHHEALPYEDMPTFYRQMWEVEREPHLERSIVTRCLAFTILTACRTGEAVYAQADEFKLDHPDGPVWIIPGERTKTRKEHVVPLSDQAVALVRPLLKITASAGSNYLFTYDTDVVNATPGEPINERSMYNLLRRLHPVATVHGFRSTFQDWAEDVLGASPESVDASLAHKIKNKTRAAYRRRTALAKRRQIMQTWASYCDGTLKVLPVNKQTELVAV